MNSSSNSNNIIIVILLLLQYCLIVLPSAPSPFSTSSPTFDPKGFDTSPAYAYYNYISTDDSYSKSIVFGTYFFKGITYYGDCREWYDFMNINLNPPIYGQPFFDSLNVKFNNYDESLVSNKVKTLQGSCNNGTIANSIIRNLKAGLNISLQCGGYNWRTFKCGSSLNLCIDCPGICGLSSCPSNTFIFNPCSSCPVPKAMAGFLFTTLKHFDNYPITTKPIVVSRFRDNVTVAINMSSPGNIYCAPYYYNEIPSSVLDIKFKDGSNFDSIFNSGLINITLTGLSPSTKYVIYCYTEDFYFNRMPYQVMKKTAVNASTLCCMGLQLTKTNPFIYIRDRYRASPLFKFKLTLRPMNYTLISLNAYQLKNCSSKSITGLPALNNVDILQPLSFTIGPNDLSMEKSFIISSEKALGCVAIEIKANQSYGSILTFTSINNLPIVPPMPQVTRAVPLDDGTVGVFFDSNTDQAGLGTGWIFDCSLRLQIPTLTDKVYCTWASPTQLNILSKWLQVGDSFTINGNGIRAQVLPPPTITEKYTYIPTSTYYISAPTEKVFFTPVLATPSVVNKCDAFEINTAAVIGTGGRPWYEVKWDSTSSSIKNDLDNNYNTGSKILSSLSIPNYKLPSGTQTISLRVTNLLLQQSQASVNVRFADDINHEGDLRVIIFRSPKVITYRNSVLSLFASAALSSCADAITAGQIPLITYRWVVYKDDVPVDPALESNAYDPKNFRLEPYMLDSMATYTVQVVAQYKNNKNNVMAGSAKIVVEVGEVGVEVVIDGGSSLVFLDTKRNVVTTSCIDLDYPEQSVNLTYSWGCMLDKPMYGSRCPSIDNTGNSSLVLRASVFKPGVTYLLTVLVTSLRGHSGRATTSVTFTNTTSPFISVDKLKAKYSPDEKVVVAAQIDFPYDGTVTWSTDSKEIVSLSNIAITPLQIDCSPGAFTSQLVIAEGSLLAGVSYSLTLDAKLNDRPGAAQSVIWIVMNKPPYGGTLSVDPSIGFALQQLFTLSAYSWTDDFEDLPLNYRFTYYTVDSSRAALLAPSSEQSVVSVLLGLGNFLNNYMGTCSVSVTDSYGAAGVSNVNVKVDMFSPLKKDAIDDMNKMLTSALSEKNGIQISQVLSGALSLINYQDCALPSDLVSKKITCSSLNRKECSKTAKTCGPCKDGYVGIFGDANVACTSAAAADIGQSCTKNSDCAVGACSGFPKKCAPIAKTCPNDCNGRGECKYYDESNSEISACLVTDSFCTAACVCGKDAVTGQKTFGQDCSIDSLTDFSTIASGREAVCVTLQNTLGLQEFNGELFQNYVLTLSNVIQDPTQLTDTGLATCVNFLVSLTTTYPDFASESESAEMLMLSFSNVLKKGALFASLFNSNVMSALRQVMDGVQRNLALGQEPVKLVTPAIRSETSLNLVGKSFVRTFSIPRTPLEEKEGRNVSSLSLAIKSSTADMGGLGVTVTQSFLRSSLDKSYTSSNIRLDLKGYAKSAGVGRRLVSAAAPLVDINVTLPNSQPVTYFLKPSSEHVLFCLISAKEYDISVSCENGRTLTHTCNGKKGTWLVTCGKFASVPICKTWEPSSGSFVPDARCSVASFSPTETRCSCSQKGLFQRKLLASKQNVYEFGVGAGIIYDDDVSEYVPILGYIPRVKNENSISYANGVIVGVFLIGSLFFLLWDLADGQARSQKMYEEMEKRIISKNSFKETLSEVRTIKSVLDKVLPRDFGTDNWHAHFWSLMKRDYNFIALFMPEQFSGKFRLSNWILATWRYLPYVLGDTVLAYFLYPDDGACEGILYKEDCLSLRSSGSIRDMCGWREDIQYCYYEDPEVSFYNVVMLAAAVTVAAHFANKLLEFVCHRAGDIEVFDTIYREVSKRDDDNFDVGDDDDDDDAKNRPPPVKLDEFTMAQTLRGKMLRAAKLSRSQELMDFVSPSEERSLLLCSSLYTNKRYHDSLIGNLKAMGLAVPKDKLIAQARIEKKILSSIREARRVSKQMVKEMNSMQEDEAREVFLLKHFLLDRFRGPRRPIALRYLFESPPMGAAQKYTLLVVGFVCLVLLPIIFALYLYITWTYDSYIGTRAIPLWSQVLTVAIFLDLFLLQWFVVWIKAYVVEATFGADMSHLDRFFRRLSRIALLRTSGLMRESNAAMQHFNPACRTARCFPGLPAARLLISLGDADLPPKQRAKVKEFFFRAFMFFYSALTMIPENMEDFVIELLTIVFFYACCVALNLINWIFSVIIAVFVLLAFFGNELYYYYDYRKRNYRPTAEDVNAFLKDERMIQQRKKKQAAHSTDKLAWSRPLRSSSIGKRLSSLVSKQFRKVGVSDVEEEMAKRDEDPVPLNIKALEEGGGLGRETKEGDNFEEEGGGGGGGGEGWSVDQDDQDDEMEEKARVAVGLAAVSPTPTPTSVIIIEQLSFAEKLRSPLNLRDKVTGGPIQNKKTGYDQQLEIEKKQKENSTGQIYYDFLNDPRAAINEEEESVELVPFVPPPVVLGSATFVQYNEEDQGSPINDGRRGGAPPTDGKEKYFVQPTSSSRRAPAVKRPEMTQRVVVRAQESPLAASSSYVDKYLWDESIGQYRPKTNEMSPPPVEKRDGRERRGRRDKNEEKELTEDEMKSSGANKRRLRSSKKTGTIDPSKGPGATSTTEMKSLSGQIHEDISSKFLVLTTDDAEEIPYVDFINFQHEEGGESAQDEVLQRHGGSLKGPGALKLRVPTPPPEEDNEGDHDDDDDDDGKPTTTNASEWKTAHEMEAHIYHVGIKVKHLAYPTLVNDDEVGGEEQEEDAPLSSSSLSLSQPISTKKE